MGCATSKLDDLPAVTLCRLRLSNLNLALHFRHSLSHSHLSYLHSLSSLSLSLRHFFNSSSLPPPSPSPAHSPTDSHLHFNSDSDNPSSPLHHPSPPPPDRLGFGFGFEQNSNHGYMNINYMKTNPTPSSLSYHHTPPTSETIRFGPGDPSSSTPSSNYYYNHANFGAVEGKVVPKAAPPPPPPAASTSTWDFLNFFEAMEGSYPSYTPSMDSREVREKEGIPDLEDDSFDHRDHNFRHSQFHPHHRKFVVHSITDHDDDVENSDAGSKREKNEDVGPSGAEKPVEYEVHVLDKKVVVGEETKKGKGKWPKPGSRSVFEVVREIQIQFERASASGNELYKVLEVGKFQYQPKNAAFQVSSRMLNAITPSLPSTSKESEATLDPDEDVQLRSMNLSASLQKLLLWEKKLFEEVKAEEKMRVQHDKKLQKLKCMGARGAEAHKIESTRGTVRDLSTRINMAIQVVDNISVKINKVRDEELWPQLNELIQGLSRMWKAMLECHHNQCQAIVEARGLDSIAFPQNPSDSQLEASLQLEHDLINWTYRFTEWVGAQKGFVRALNGWLVKCLYLEPEETVDGVAPFSPGRAGAPPVFVICNMWDLSLERICETSGKEVVDSMRDFASTIWHFRERDKGEMRQRMTANRDIERKVKNLERQDSKMLKEMQALDKKLLLTSGDSDGILFFGQVVYQRDTSSKTGLQAGLLRIFEAMDRFAADSVKVYEELLQRSEELVQEHRRVS